MQAYRRQKTIPPTLRSRGTGGEHAANAGKLYEQTQKPVSITYGYWNQSDIRGALFAMQGDTCAYCQKKLGQDGSVDHFRPKNKVTGSEDRYWWLAHDYSNLLYSCHRCNSKLKLNKFPCEGARCDYEARARLEEESRLLIDPTQDPVDGGKRK